MDGFVGCLEPQVVELFAFLTEMPALTRLTTTDSNEETLPFRNRWCRIPTRSRRSYGEGVILDSQIRSPGQGSQTYAILIRTELDKKVCVHNPKWRGILASALGTLRTEGDCGLSLVTTSSDRSNAK